MTDDANQKTTNGMSVPENIGPLRRSILWLLLTINRQILKIAFRHQVLVPELEKLIRWQGVRLALEDPELATLSHMHEGSSAAHAAVLTGLARPEVANVNKQSEIPVPPDGGELHRLIRIVTAWSAEDDYRDENGNPVDLPLTGKPPSLHSLNRRFGRGVPDRALADWLVRNDNAEWIGDPDGKPPSKMLRWKSPIVQTESFTEDDVIILGQIASDFLHSLQESANPLIDDQPRMRETFFSDIPAEKLAEAHEALKAVVSQADENVRKVLNQYRDGSAKNPIRLGAGFYTFKETPLLEELDASKCGKRSYYNKEKLH